MEFRLGSLQQLSSATLAFLLAVLPHDANPEAFLQGVGSLDQSPGLAADGDDEHWWDGFGDLSKRGLNAWVDAFCDYNRDLISGGWFSLAGDGVQASCIARWDGREWHSLAGGLASEPLGGPDYWPWVEDMVVYNGSLIVAGHFRYANGYGPGGFRVNNIARWDGTSWHSLGSGLGSAPSDYCWRVVVYNGDLIASGRFTVAGDQPANYIARWDGNSWHPMSEGSWKPSGNFIVYHGDLIASSGYTMEGGRSVVRWTGTEWLAFGNQEPEPFTDVIAYHDTLVANIYHYQNGFQYRLVSKWNGISWVPLGQNLKSEVGEVDRFEIYNDRLYAGGFLKPTFNNIARWNGQAWEPLGSGVSSTDPLLDGAVRALKVHRGSLYTGGRFNMAGGKASWCIARWDDVITAIEVANLTAISTFDGIQLRWEVPRQMLQQLRGIHVQRAETALGPYAALTQLPLAPDLYMTFLDKEIHPGLQYWYRLVLLSREGSEEITGPVGVTATDEQGGRARLYAPVESNSDGAIEIRYRIGCHQTLVRLDIFDVNGRLLRSLEQGRRDSGEYMHVWNRHDNKGTKAVRGVYLVRLIAGNVKLSKKLVLAHD